jgi:hypothetical protein
MLAVVVTDVEIESEYQFERRMLGSNSEQLRSLAARLLEQEAEEVVMANFLIIGLSRGRLRNAWGNDLNIH